jgi:hypothetical protein
MNITLKEFRTKGHDRPLTIHTIRYSYSLYRWLHDAFFPLLKSEKMFIATADEGGRIVLIIPNNGQKFLKDYVGRDPKHAALAWNESINAFVFTGTNNYPFGELSYMATGQSHYALRQYVYVPGDPPNIKGKEGFVVPEPEEKKGPVGFKLLPPELNNNDKVPDLHYLHHSYLTYKMNGAQV